MPPVLTRDPDFPAEIANLVRSFSSCSGGHSTVVVLEAAANLLIWAINAHARATRGGCAEAVEIAESFADRLPGAVYGQWHRDPKPTDIEVGHG